MIFKISSTEYEGFDDVYGHSVEDDHCISPSEARFLYDRTRHPQMSAFINEDNYIAEEDENNAIRDQHVTELEKCTQVAVDEDKLRLCLDDIQNVIGDIFPQSTVKEIVIRYNYDVNKCLDHILSETSGNVSIGLYIIQILLLYKCLLMHCRISLNFKKYQYLIAGIQWKQQNYQVLSAHLKN